MLINIIVKGCDDETDFKIEATEAEFEFLKRVAKRCNDTSEYGCQPTMEVSR
jgi:hypothetical protein